MNRYKSESAVDRLIALASDDEPARENHFQDQPETVEETVPGPAESAREGGEIHAGDVSTGVSLMFALKDGPVYLSG